MQDSVKEVVAEKVAVVEVKEAEVTSQVVGSIAPKEQTIAERTKVADAKVALPLAPNGQTKAK